MQKSKKRRQEILVKRVKDFVGYMKDDGEN